MKLREVRQHYRDHEDEIERRLTQFEKLRRSPDRRWFKELVFVILTSKSSAKSSWEAVEELDNRGLLIDGSKQEIAEVLEEFGVSFEASKADYIVRNRELLAQPTLTQPEKGLKLRQKLDLNDLEKSRAWLVENIRGLSWKGGSHFLRNIGYGDEFGIVSQHILTALKQLGLIENVEPPRTEDEYGQIEAAMRELAEETGIDVKALDLVLWSMETGEVFK